MLHPLSKFAAFVLLTLLALVAVGCSDSLTGTQPAPSFAISNRGYEKTLTPDQQKAAIAELRSEQARREGTGQDTIASVRPVQSQH